MLATAQFHHAAVAARRIRDLLPLYETMLGGAFLNGADSAAFGYRAVQLGYSGGTRIELMEPLPGSTFLDTFLAGRPQGGVHHLTFLVADIAEALHDARKHGFRPVGVQLESTMWREAFLHPREANGVLLQLAETGPDYSEVLAGTTLDDVLAGRGLHGTGVASP